MDGWLDAVDLEALADGKPSRVLVDGEPVLLLRAGDDLFAIGDRCTHRGALLDQGAIRIAGSVRTVTCPAHGSMFRLDDGKVMRPPASKPVQAYDVKVDDGRIFLRRRDEGDAPWLAVPHPRTGRSTLAATVRRRDELTMSEENKALVRRLVEEWQSGHRPEVAEEIVADDFVDRTPGPGQDTTREAAIQSFLYLWQAFPDFSAEIKMQLAEGDLVATMKTFSGTHEGEFMGVPPTGKQVAFDVFDILRLRDGKVVEHWNVVDTAGLMQQLGGAMSGPDG